MMSDTMLPPTAEDKCLLELQAVEKERERREGFEAMGRESDTNSVEFMLPAAREVLKLGA